MLKAANEDQYNFLDEVKVYGERARRLKEIFLRHGFHLVYDNDLGDPVADGFYFTIGYPGMSSGELARELMYYGVSAISLVTTGSHQEGLRACTSFIQDHQYDQLDERMAIFARITPSNKKYPYIIRYLYQLMPVSHHNRVPALSSPPSASTKAAYCSAFSVFSPPGKFRRRIIVSVSIHRLYCD